MPNVKHGLEWWSEFRIKPGILRIKELKKELFDNKEIKVNRN